MSPALVLADELTGKLGTKSADTASADPSLIRCDASIGSAVRASCSSPKIDLPIVIRNAQAPASWILDACSSYFSTAPVQSLKPPTL